MCVLRYAGAVAAFLIGSGFASGQEVVQFFTCYGPARGLLGALLSLVVLSFMCAVTLSDARRAVNTPGKNVFVRYCGPCLGGVLGWLLPLFLLGMYAVMLAGAGALGAQAFGWPVLTGRVGMLVLSLVTVLAGLDRLTDVVGRVGPVLLALVLLVSAGALAQSPGMTGVALTAALPRAAKSWWVAALVYAAFNAFSMMPFLDGLAGRMAAGKLPEKVARRAALLGAGAFAGAAALLHLALSANLPEILGSEVPTVLLAERLFPGGGRWFAPVLLAGVYTTAVPMLWTVCRRLAPVEHTPRFYLAAGLAALAGFAGSALPFGRLVGALYPVIGYMGLLVLAGMLAGRLRRRKRENVICWQAFWRSG